MTFDEYENLQFEKEESIHVPLIWGPKIIKNMTTALIWIC